MAQTMKLPSVSFGWIVALIVAIVAVILWGLGELGREPALVILAICSRRL